MIHLALRKLRSATSLLLSKFSTIKVYLWNLGNPSAHIDKHCTFGKSVKLLATDGGNIHIGPRTHIGANCNIIASGGKLVIENDVFIGPGSNIVCQENIFIGRNTLIAEYTVIRDQDHRTHTKPISLSGFITAPIYIGRDVWVGCKASILRGVIVGDGAVVGAHALVRSDVPAGKLAVGVPAHVVGPVGGSA